MLWLIALWASTVSGEYMFTFPRTMEADSITSFCLILDDIKYEGFDSERGYKVDVALDYTHSEGGVTSTEHVTVTFAIVSSDEDFYKCQQLRAPGTPGTHTASVNVTLTYTPDGETEAVTEKIISASKDVIVSKPELITLIQTDKPIYKPGETVKFRVMTMDYKLAARTDNYEEITIETPAGLRVMQWRDVPTSSGLVSLKMPLSSDPVLGDWNIKAVYGSKTTEQSFKVDEYVLPKFEVTITPPKYLLPTSKTISGTVCAKYTYGKPVKGQLRMDVCFSTYYYSYYDQPRPCASVSEKIDGCYEFFVDAEDVKLGHREYPSWGTLKINATVTEDETGIELRGTSEGPSLDFYPLQLRMEDDSNNFYKPGFPYHGRVIVTNPDGSPAPGEEISVQADHYDLDYTLTKNFTTDLNGVVHFTITDIDSSIGYLNLRANAIVYETDWRYNEDELYFRTYTPQAYSRLTKWSSRSNSYMYIPDVDAEVDCDSELMLDVYFNAEMDETYKFISIVRAGDIVVSTNEHTVDSASISYDLDILSVDESQKLSKIARPPVPTVPPLPPLPPEPMPFIVETVEFSDDNATSADDDKDGDDKAEEEPETVEEEIIVPVVAQKLGKDTLRRKRASHLIGHFKMSVPVRNDMSPSAKVLVFYVRDDKEVISSSIDFEIKDCFRNKVSMTFEEKSIHPGADAKLNLAASPDSTCFVGMVDKSVNLLAGSNQLTPKQVFQRVEQAGRPHHYISYWEEDRIYCEGNKKPQEGEFPSYYGYYSPEGIDAVWPFRDLSLWVETDFVLETRPCKERRYVYYRMDVRAEVGPPGLSGPEGVVAMPLAKESTSKQSVVAEQPKSQPVKIRSLFPESWLWDIFQLGPDGTFQLTIPIPDTITEWVGNALCTHSTDGVGVSEVTGVTAFQPFFVSLTLPYSAIRGETLPVLITVFNYLENCLTMELNMKEREGFQFTDASASSRQFCLCGGEAESTKFYIVPSVIGEIDIEVTAVSIENSGLCDNVVLSEDYVGVSDGVQRQLRIEAEGVEQDLTTGSYICVKDGESAKEKFVFTLPDDLVPDSQRATLSVVGDIMGPTLSNLKNLLRMPYGCGEQNMASWSPNIYVLQYLSNTNQLTEDLEKEAEGYMRVGYQRQLKYRHNDNSYSAWGENDFGNATGSLWLTAFVVKSMAKSSPYIEIDQEDVRKSAVWLAEKQQAGGCFPQVGKVFSSYLKGGLTGEDPVGLTAFTLIALLEAKLGFHDVIRNGFTGCLDMPRADTLDTYTLSLMLYAYTLYDLNGPRRAEILSQLELRKIQKEGFVYWQREEDKPKEDEGYYWYRAPSAEVEMTAYIMMSRLAEGPNSIAGLQPVIQWLTKQRNPYGGFSSTQDTVVALQALALFGSMTYSDDMALTINAKNSRLDQTFTVNAENSLVYQSVDLIPDDGPVELTVSGKGCALVQTNLKYNIYKDDSEGPAFDVDVTVYRLRTPGRNCHLRTLEVCATYLKGQISNMAIAEVKMPTGWVPDDSSLQELVSSNRIQKYEVDKNYVQIYFDELTRRKVCVGFKVEQEIELSAKPAHVRVYDYYETSYSVSEEYEIKTTCGTKEEIPFDNAGLNCEEVQCRVTSKEETSMKCPSCLESLDDKLQLETLICDSSAVFKSIVGRRGDYPIKIKANIREKEKQVMDTFVKYKMNPACKCPIITSDTESRALVFTDGMALNTRTSELWLQEGVTVLTYQAEYEKLVRQLSSKANACSKIERLKRSSSPRSATRLARLRRRLGIA